MTPALDRRRAAAQQLRAHRVARVWWALGWLGVGLTLILSLMPPTLGKESGQLDKLVHLSGYAVLMYWWAQLVIARRWRLALAIVLLGISIEFLQGLTPDRMPDPLDALANTGGVLLGWLVARFSPNLPAHIAPLPGTRR